MGEAHSVIHLRERCLPLYSLPEVAPSPVVLRGFGQACKWQMDNGRPRRSRLAHVLFMRRECGRGWLIAAMPPVTHHVRNTLCPLRRCLSPLSASENPLWPVQEKKKKPYVLFLCAICFGKESDDMDSRPGGCDRLLAWNTLHNPAPAEQIFNYESSECISIYVVYLSGK